MKPTTSRPLRKQTNAVPSSGGSRPSDKGGGDKVGPGRKNFFVPLGLSMV